MQIPRVFVRVCRGGFPLSESGFVTAQGDVDIVPLIAVIVEANVNPDERKELRDFLDELLSGAYTEAQIQAIYEGTDPTLGVEPVSSFLKMLRHALN
ncbi:MAG: hypothetical protein K2X10_04825 [Hyphomicrobiales bacterium]|nr:hypothetical protein [Hyphomicrobiales bacterium]